MVNDISKIELVGDRIVVELKELQDHTVTEGGVIVTKAEVTETDGGRLTTNTSADKRTTEGKIVAISAYSSKKVLDYDTTLSIGDTVLLSRQVLQDSFRFTPDRNALVFGNSNYVCVPHTLIEAKLKD